jgi:hypothetical protein
MQLEKLSSASFSKVFCHNINRSRQYHWKKLFKIPRKLHCHEKMISYPQALRGDLSLKLKEERREAHIFHEFNFKKKSYEFLSLTLWG